MKGTAREAGLWDRLVNDKWEGERPVLTGPESIAAARKLYRHIMGKAFRGPVKLTSGNRYTWVRRGTLYVNPDQRSLGLRELIHSLSHYCHQKLHPKDAPHSARQAYIERDMVRFALDHDFLTGGIQTLPQPKLRDLVQERYARMKARLDKWEAKKKHAERMHARALRDVRQYEKRHGERLDQHSCT